MNLTLSVDEQLVERAREVARQQGTSLNALIRQYLESLAGDRQGTQLVEALERLWAEEAGHSGGKAIRREDAYLGRVHG